MTRDEKLQAIEDMGIDISLRCPDTDYGIGCRCTDWFKDGATQEKCEICWIKTLEENQ